MPGSPNTTPRPKPLPCPFCGKIPEADRDMVWCDNEECWLAVADRMVTITGWNKRPPPSGVAEQAEPTQDALPPGESPQRTALCDAMVQMWTYAGRLAEAADEGITLDDTPGEPWMFDLRNPKAARALARLLTTRDAEGRDGELGEQTRAFWNRLRDSLAAPVPAAEPQQKTWNDLVGAVDRSVESATLGDFEGDVLSADERSALASEVMGDFRDYLKAAGASGAEERVSEDTGEVAKALAWWVPSAESMTEYVTLRGLVDGAFVDGPQREDAEPFLDFLIRSYRASRSSLPDAPGETHCPCLHCGGDGWERSDVPPDDRGRDACPACGGSGLND